MPGGHAYGFDDASRSDRDLRPRSPVPDPFATGHVTAAGARSSTGSPGGPGFVFHDAHNQPVHRAAPGILGLVEARLVMSRWRPRSVGWLDETGHFFDHLLAEFDGVAAFEPSRRELEAIRGLEAPWPARNAFLFRYLDTLARGLEREALGATKARALPADGGDHDLNGTWTVRYRAGDDWTERDVALPVNWELLPGIDDYAGTMRFSRTFAAPEAAARRHGDPALLRGRLLRRRVAQRLPPRRPRGVLRRVLLRRGPLPPRRRQPAPGGGHLAQRPVRARAPTSPPAGTTSRRPPPSPTARRWSRARSATTTPSGAARGARSPARTATPAASGTTCMLSVRNPLHLDPSAVRVTALSASPVRGSTDVPGGHPDDRHGDEPHGADAARPHPAPLRAGQLRGRAARAGQGHPPRPRAQRR